MYNSDLAEILPKLGGRNKGEKNVPLKRSLLKRLSKQSSHSSRRSNIGGHPHRGSKAAHSKAPGSFSQRCIVKARVVKMQSSGKKAADLHLKYIQRDGVEEDGSPGKLYGPEEEINTDEFGRVIKGEPHQFRFIVSPENAHDLDLTDHTKKLMGQMEKDLSRKLDWAAVNHYNTDNPHTHIVVRGLDTEGNEVRIDRDYISHGIRNRAVEIATMELGRRSEYELEQQVQKEIKAERFTGLDYKIEKLAENSPDPLIVSLGDYPDNTFERINQIRTTSRLETLESLGLAKLTKYRSWELSDGWQEVLKDLGKRNDIVKTIHRRINGDPSKYKIITNNTEPLKIVGRLGSKGLSNELYDKYHLIIEGADGIAYYVDAHRGMKIDELKEGNIVYLSVDADSWLKSSDKRIAEFARKHGGIYSAEAHKAEIGKDTIKVGGRDPKTGKPGQIEIKTKDFIKSHERRLHRLQTYDLAKKAGGDNWVIDPKIVEELERRDLKRPINRVGVQKSSEMKIEKQATYRGPTWIDSYTTPPSDPWSQNAGFGADVNKQAKIRRQFLKEIGVVETNSGALTKRLEQMEYDETVNKLKGQKRMAFKRMQVMMKFKGQLSCKALKSGKVYAVISDQGSKEFSMVPWKKQYEKAIGSNVQMQLDSAGNFTMKKINRSIGR